jgi:hypothetical protein
MKDINNVLNLSQEDLKEIFALFTSPTQHEKEQIYDQLSEHYFLKINLFTEYSLTEEKREFAIDAWRAVIYFLYRKGYSLHKEDVEVDLSFSDRQFI